MLISESDKRRKVTQGQLKKFHTSFTREEKQLLNDVIKHIDVNTVRLSTHIHREFDLKDIIEAFENGVVYEYNTNGKDNRILIKGNKPIKMKFDNKIQNVHISIVYSLTYNTIVTLYYNPKKESFRNTYDIRRYTNIKVDLKEIKKIIKNSKKVVVK